ncbi:hypothetical protein EDD29_7113 [Actinocorallia herbida]|uniref:Uncharacterized protein n=1 Tax=Actinocorallia herbida TaxID=58109 RepID=A0A3N1D7B4_9ACTN|nr:hypothetical protein [Actinocorallia herbida]ROO89423.1 hypothetical protein EDD29_7113 [Actinocorallia herbida]
MDKTFVLPVPAELRAVCVVAAPLSLPVGLGSGALALVELVTAGVPPLPWLIGPSAHCPRCVPGGLDIDSGLVRRMRAADFHLRVSAVGGPRWPPRHLTEAAALAFVLAEETGGILLDAVTGDVEPWSGPPEPFDDGPGEFAAAEWIGVVSVPEDRGRGWTLTTAGLAVLGLPELRVTRIPEELRRPWSDVLSGLAQHLLLEQWADLEAAPASAFREIPAEVGLTAAEVGRATAGCPHRRGAALLALRLDPGTPGGPPTLLSVVAPAPRGPARRTGSWREDVVTELAW